MQSVYDTVSLWKKYITPLKIDKTLQKFEIFGI